MKVIGHRGWPARYPENTLAGFRAAVRAGVDAIELDVHLSADDRVVVIHDERTGRVADRDLDVRASTLDELKTLDVGATFDPAFTGERIPTLEEVIDAVDRSTPFLVEVKEPGETTERLNVQLLPLVDALAGRVTVQSFDADYLRAFRALRPDVPTGYLCDASPEALATTRAIGCSGFHPSWNTLTGEITRDARDAGLSLYVWNVRTVEDCRRVLDLDVDSVVVDHPDVMLDLLKLRGG